MSSRLAMRVLESALDGSLKFTATVLALHADDEGYKIFPSIARLAWLMGISVRKVKYQLKHLRNCGVLIPLSSLKGGRRQVSHYQLQLPLEFDRPSWQAEVRRSLLQRCKKGAPACTLSAVNGAAENRETVQNPVERVHAETETVHVEVKKGADVCTRSLREHPIEHSEGDALAAPAAPPPAEPTSARLSFLELVRQNHPELAKSFERVRTFSGSHVDNAGAPSARYSGTPAVQEHDRRP